MDQGTPDEKRDREHLISTLIKSYDGPISR
jgi:hypothetical protein